MLSGCPYPDCAQSFEFEGQGRITHCPHCRRVCSARPLEAFKHIDKQWERYNQQIKPDAHTPGLAIGPEFVVAILEDIRSLWNVGSIFRTADGAGISSLILCGITGYPPRKEIAKTSLGAEETVHWEYRRHPLQLIPDLKEAGVMIVGLERTADSTLLSEGLARNEIHRPLCLIVGNEVTGVSAETLAACDKVCHLPMSGIKESLNVAVAFGVAAYLVAERTG